MRDMDIRQSLDLLHDLPYEEVERMAKSTGLHINTLLMIRKGGTSNPRLETCERIAEYFDQVIAK